MTTAALSREAFDPDDLGRRDSGVVAALLPVFERLSRHYLGLRVEGREHISRAPTLYVGNHNGGVMGPDLICTLSMLWGSLGAQWPLYAMAHDFAMRTVLPVGRALQLVGAVRADPTNADRVLSNGASVLVYPGGDLEAFRHFRDRDRIVFGHRTGFIRAAQRAGVSVTPIVAQGAHRSSVIFHDGAYLARALGLTRAIRLQRFPIALGLPWGIGAGPIPYLPLPLPIRLRILRPIEIPPDADPALLRERVAGRMQLAMDEMAARGKL